MIINLTKPVYYKDSELMSLELDLESLTGYDILSVEDDLRMKGVNVGAWEYSRGFIAAIASRAAKIPVEVINSMSIQDFTKTINKVISFLAGTVTGDSTEKNSGN